MNERIKKLSEFLNKEDDNPSDYISKELFEKYNIFKKWLKDNGAIFEKNIDFPYTYGPFHIIGCKCVSKINENEAILLIPRHLMLIAKDFHYLDKLLENQLESLLGEEDMATLYLVLHLYLEKNNKDSFHKPYIDLIFTNQNFLQNWTHENLQKLENDKISTSFKIMLLGIENTYKRIIKCKTFEKMTYEDFSNCYFQVASRQFYIDDHNSALIPLADLLNHNSVKIKYEIYNSENFVFKYTMHFTNKDDRFIDILPTHIKEIPYNKPSYNRLLPIYSFENKININKKEVEEEEDDDEENEEEEEEEDSESSDNKPVELDINDYFCISTSKNQFFEKGSQAYNDYGDSCNKGLLKYYGFCLLDNRFDYTNIYFSVIPGDYLLEKHFLKIFGKRFIVGESPLYNYLKVRIPYNDISIDLLIYYRFMFFYETKKDLSLFWKYKFDVPLEICIINLSIHCLKHKISLMESDYTLEENLELLEKEVIKENPDLLTTNILIFKIRQLINIYNQIDLLTELSEIINDNRTQVFCYLDLAKYLKNLKNISNYDTHEQNKLKILRFLARLHYKKFEG